MREIWKNEIVWLSDTNSVILHKLILLYWWRISMGANENIKISNTKEVMHFLAEHF